MRAFRKGTSIIEVAVVIFIVSFGLTTVYLILSRGMKLADTTSNRIAAINLAREGIETVTNQRDTNWVKFAADYPSCWKTKNYDKGCVGALGVPAQQGHWVGGGFGQTSVVPFLSGGIWYLTDATANSGVYMDDRGLPFQTGSASPAGYDKTCQFVDPNATNCKTNMKRVVVLGHPDSGAGEPAWCGAGTGCLSVSSRVEWFDGASQRIHTVRLDTTLTNWRGNF